MSSIKIQVGFAEDNGPKKGGSHNRHTHTDIFGIGDAAQPTPKKNQPTSNIKNILMEETDGAKEAKENNQAQMENKTDHVNGNVPAMVATPQRVRIPPGGFSSGLW